MPCLTYTRKVLRTEITISSPGFASLYQPGVADSTRTEFGDLYSPGVFRCVRRSHHRDVEAGASMSAPEGSNWRYSDRAVGSVFSLLAAAVRRCRRPIYAHNGLYGGGDRQSDLPRLNLNSVVIHSEDRRKPTVFAPLWEGRLPIAQWRHTTWGGGNCSYYLGPCQEDPATSDRSSTSEPIVSQRLREPQYGASAHVLNNVQ
jgi:hypothetical protein